MPQWGTFIEVERRNRLMVCLWAYSYEQFDESIVDDATFDEVCRSINPDVDTGNKIIDDFFAKRFSPDTGQWIGAHPEYDKFSRYFHYLKSNGCLKPIKYKGNALLELEEEDPLS